MVVENEFQSQPFPNIHHTNDETLEGSSWCELLESIQTHSFLVWKVGVYANPTFSPPMARTYVVVTILQTSIQSWPCLIIHHTNDETLEGSSSCEWCESVLNTLNSALKSRGLGPKLSPSMTPKSWSGDGCGEWIPISALSKHSSY